MTISDITLVKVVEQNYKEEEEIPPIFKALASITAWILWVSGLVMGFSIFIMGIIRGVLYGPEPAPVVVPVFFAVALAYGVSAVVVMKLRKMLE